MSTTVWDKLQRLDDNPFVYANPVPHPPGQLITPSKHGGFETHLIEKFVMPLAPARSN